MLRVRHRHDAADLRLRRSSWSSDPGETLRPLFAAGGRGVRDGAAVRRRWTAGCVGGRSSCCPAARRRRAPGHAVRAHHGWRRQPDVVPVPAADLGRLRWSCTVAAGWRWPSGRCAALYGAFVLAPAGLAADGFVPAEPGRVAYLALAHLVALVAFGGAARSHLSERLRAQGRELDERQGAVARLKALNENIIESINSGLITTDLDGRINFLNRGGSEILRAAPRDVEGRSIADLLGSRTAWRDDIRRRLLANRRFRFERFHDDPGRPAHLPRDRRVEPARPSRASPWGTSSCSRT